MTGSGKSTLINSLLFGPDFLQIKQLTEEVNIMKKNGQTNIKKIRKKIIDFKENF